MSRRRKARPARVDPVPEIDVSVLRPPIEGVASGVYDFIRSISNGTSELRDTLLTECELLLECRMCRSMFRSLPNFLAHKRVYCTALFKAVDLIEPSVEGEVETIVIQPEGMDLAKSGKSALEKQGDSESVILIN